MSNTFISFWSSNRDGFSSDVSRLEKSIQGTLGEANQDELNELHDALHEHFVKIRDTVEEFDKRIEARQEAERQAELAEREDFILDMDDGTKAKFNGPQGWDSKTGVIMTYDLFDLVVEEGRITSAKRMYMGRCSSLSEWDINVCNSLLQRV
jgi:hypothetical protein